MIDIPEDIEKWTPGLIYDIIDNAYDEDETLDFKSDITKEPEYIAKTCCAFTNTKGGIIVFGVNNDRKIKLTTPERMIGLEDSDDLKVRIINQIKGILPNISIDKVLFKKSNIRFPNGRVAVILKILASEMSPHQYNGLCYKRIGSKNQPMLIDEIKYNILESAKNGTLFNMFLSEGGFLRAQVKTMQNNLNENPAYSLQTCKYMDPSTVIHFLYHQSHLYSDEIQQLLMTLVESIRKMIKLVETVIKFMKEDSEITKHVFEKEGAKTVEEWAKNLYRPLIVDTLSNFDELEKLLNIKFLEPVNYDMRPLSQRKSNKS